MAHNFYHIGINELSTVEKQQQLERFFASFVSDWLRYGVSSWIVWTDKNAQQLAEGLRPYLPTSEYLVIQVNQSADKQGFLKPWVWEWINKQRPQQIGSAYPGALSGYTSPRPPGPLQVPQLPPTTRFDAWGRPIKK